MRVRVSLNYKCCDPKNSIDIDRESWLKILKIVGRSEVELRDQRYDYVVHLVTAALGAEKFYGKQNNHARSESIELARKLDKLCQNAWVGHPYFVSGFCRLISDAFLINCRMLSTIQQILIKSATG